jgi:hypothetical protein
LQPATGPSKLVDVFHLCVLNFLPRLRLLT